jgi:hypothetical protein
MDVHGVTYGVMLNPLNGFFREGVIMALNDTIGTTL